MGVVDPSVRHSRTLWTASLIGVAISIERFQTLELFSWKSSFSLFSVFLFFLEIIRYSD